MIDVNIMVLFLMSVKFYIRPNMKTEWNVHKFTMNECIRNRRHCHWYICYTLNTRESISYFKDKGCDDFRYRIYRFCRLLCFFDLRVNVWKKKTHNVNVWNMRKRIKFVEMHSSQFNEYCLWDLSLLIS